MRMGTRSDAGGPGRRERRRWRSSAVVLLVFALVAACGDDEEPADDADAAEDFAESAGARTVAEALRASLVGEELDDDARRGEVTVLQDAVENLPGEPDVAGIEDRDGDGRDDDGLVEVRVDEEVACVAVAADGEVDVSGGAC